MQTCLSATQQALPWPLSSPLPLSCCLHQPPPPSLINPAHLLQSGSVERHADVFERHAACSALAAVIAFASELLADAANHRKFELSLYNQGRFMR